MQAQERAHTPLTREEVMRRLQAQADVLRALGVRKLGVFGSVARGEARPGSDVDILVEFETGQKSFDRFLQVASFLEHLLECRVELVTPEGLSPYIAPYVYREVLYVPFGS